MLPTREALAQAEAAGRYPVIFADMRDNTEVGSPRLVTFGRNSSVSFKKPGVTKRHRASFMAHGSFVYWFRILEGGEGAFRVDVHDLINVLRAIADKNDPRRGRPGEIGEDARER